jgi:UDP-hydrolysing UDP-N-acetyl-D-glucosamine 2-epimerase
MKRKICVVTTSRADYGLLYWLLRGIQDDPALQLQLVATGMHLAREFGFTVKEIERDGFIIDKKVDMLLSTGDEKGTIKSIGVGLISFAEVFQDLSPEIVVLLGDRYELMTIAIPALILKIPIAHLHGGETSQGAIDEAIRHSITKMAAIHFPATAEYGRRIIQMGEDPNRVFPFGAPGLDHIYRKRFRARLELESLLDFPIGGPTALVTYHPVTLEKNSAGEQIENILTAVRRAGIRAIFTKSNADPQGHVINEKIKDFCDAYPTRYKLFENLGTDLYLDCLKNLDLMIGNSSSGIVEAPSLRMPVVNVGDRQKGRTKAENILDAGYAAEEIVREIGKALSLEFKDRLRIMKNPYDPLEDGKVSLRIKEKLKEIPIDERLIKKRFHDVSFSGKK